MAWLFDMTPRIWLGSTRAQALPIDWRRGRAVGRGHLRSPPRGRGGRRRKHARVKERDQSHCLDRADIGNGYLPVAGGCGAEDRGAAQSATAALIQINAAPAPRPIKKPCGNPFRPRRSTATSSLLSSIVTGRIRSFSHAGAFSPGGSTRKASKESTCGRPIGGNGALKTSAANPKFAHNCGESSCELRVRSGTRIIELLVSFDSEVRFRTCGKLGRTSESGH